MSKEIRQELLDVFDEAPKIDFHTHLRAVRPAARHVEDLVYYHMLLIEFASVGMDTSRFHPERGNMWGEGVLDVDEAVEHYARVRNSSIARAFRAIASDMFEVEGPDVDAAFLTRLSEAIKARQSDPTWTDSVFDHMGIELAMAPAHYHTAEKYQEARGDMYPRIRFTLEHGGFRASDQTQVMIDKIEEYYGIRIRNVDSARAVVTRGFDLAEVAGAGTYVNWVWTGSLLAKEDPAAVETALKRSADGGNWTPEDGAALTTMDFKMKLDAARERGKTVQICTASMYLPGFEYPVPYTPDDYLPVLTGWLSRYPEVTFDILNSDYAIEPVLVALARTQPNINLSGIWWHAMSEGWIAEMFYRRILAVPIHKLGAFFSDAYCAEWIYGKMTIVRHGMVMAFSRAVEEGLFSQEEAVQFIRQMLYDNPKRIYRLG